MDTLYSCEGFHEGQVGEVRVVIEQHEDERLRDQVVLVISVCAIVLVVVQSLGYSRKHLIDQLKSTNHDIAKPSIDVFYRYAEHQQQCGYVSGEVFPIVGEVLVVAVDVQDVLHIGHQTHNAEGQEYKAENHQLVHNQMRIKTQK